MNASQVETDGEPRLHEAKVNPLVRTWRSLGTPFGNPLASHPVHQRILIAASALGFTIAWFLPGIAHSGDVFARATWAFLLASLPLLAYVDATEHILPNRVLYPLATLMAGSLVVGTISGVTELSVATHAAAYAAGIGVLTFLTLLLSPSGGFGMGDVRFLTTAALAFGSHTATATMGFLVLGPSILALAWTIYTGIRTRAPVNGVAFGPHICIGIAAAAIAPALFGSQLA